MKKLLYGGLVALYLLHNDWWLWNRDGRLLGLPVGLAYQVAFCLLVIVWMALLVRSRSTSPQPPAVGAGSPSGEVE
jgi:hypothetical protein